VAGSTGVGHGRRTGGIRAVHRAGEQLSAAGNAWTEEEKAAFEAPIRDQYERQGSPYYSTARLWDDGVIEPAQTRDVLGLALDVVSRVPMTDAGYGVFRM
jgi:3-methylcrotonyl-CoA carboxylase beta subunit